MMVAVVKGGDSVDGRRWFDDDKREEEAGHVIDSDG